MTIWWYIHSTHHNSSKKTHTHIRGITSAAAKKTRLDTTTILATIKRGRAVLADHISDRRTQQTASRFWAPQKANNLATHTHTHTSYTYSAHLYQTTHTSHIRIRKSSSSTQQPRGMREYFFFVADKTRSHDDIYLYISRYINMMESQNTVYCVQIKLVIKYITKFIVWINYV